MKEKMYKIYYGEGENDYIRRYLKEEDILDGFLNESKAFDIFYDNMIMCNSYVSNNYEQLDYIIDSYDEENDSYVDEYQVFIIDPAYDEDITRMATEKMGNTLYYDYKNELYLTGITDLGTRRSYVRTDLKVIEDKEKY